MNIFDAISDIDEKILLYIQNNVRNAKTDRLMKCVTHLGDLGIFWVSVITILFVNKKHRKTAFLMALTLSFGLMITNLIVKNSIQRTRPFHAIKDLFPLIAKPEDWSFPSGHATSSMGCGLVMLRKLPKKYGISGFTLALMIAFSRIYLGVHYTSDVIAGLIVGTISELSAEKTMEIIGEKRKSGSK